MKTYNDYLKQYIEFVIELYNYDYKVTIKLG